MRLRRIISGEAQPIIVEMTAAFPTVATELTLDIETIGHSVAIERVGIAGPTGPVTTVAWSAELRRWLADAVARPNVTIIGHHLQFDLARLRRAGVRVPRETALFDTMFAAKLLLPDSPMGLGSVASIYADTFRWKHKSETNPALYNAYDVAITRAIAAKQRAVIAAEGMSSLFHDMMMPGLHVLLDMTERGIPIHPGFVLGGVPISHLSALQPVGPDNCIHPTYIPDPDLWKTDDLEPPTGRLAAMNPQLSEIPSLLVPHRTENQLAHIFFQEPSRSIPSLEPLVTDGFITNAFGRRKRFYGYYKNKAGVITGPNRLAPEQFLVASTITDAIWSRLGGMEAISTALGGWLLAISRAGFIVELPKTAKLQPLVAHMETGTGLKTRVVLGPTVGSIW